MEKQEISKEDYLQQLKQRYIYTHTPWMRESAKIRRNDPCPCGSGKKFKSCCNTPLKYKLDTIRTSKEVEELFNMKIQ